MTDGVRAQIAVAPDTFALFVTAAVGVNLAAGLAGTALFWPWGSWDAMTVGLVSGNRNVTLAWAAAGGTLAPEGEAYIAACVILILSLPLLLKTAFALRARGAQASGSTAYLVPAQGGDDNDYIRTFASRAARGRFGSAPVIAGAGVEGCFPPLAASS